MLTNTKQLWQSKRKGIRVNGSGTTTKDKPCRRKGFITEQGREYDEYEDAYGDGNEYDDEGHGDEYGTRTIMMIIATVTGAVPKGVDEVLRPCGVGK